MGKWVKTKKEIVQEIMWKIFWEVYRVKYEWDRVNEKWIRVLRGIRSSIK